MQKLFAVLIVVAGAAAGGALGLQLRPVAERPGTESEVRGSGAEDGPAAAGLAHDTGAAQHGTPEPQSSGSHGGAGDHSDAHNAADGNDRDYVKLTRQIVVPVVQERETQALMLFELALDVPRGASETAYFAEPRLRDAFLRELMDLSYSGAFLATYTDDRVMAELRERLSAAARRILGDDVSDVLILDVLRQEL